MKSVLITGDDGYDSIGTKLLKEYFKGKYEIKVCGTAEQMSGVGGFSNFKTGVDYEVLDINGIETIRVEGSPCDSVVCAKSYFRKEFDLVVAGVNWGENFGAHSIVNSGTIATAHIALASNITKKAISVSWKAPPEVWFETNHHIEVRDYLKNPGQDLFEVLDLALENDLWQAQMLNINLPPNSSRGIRFTKFFPKPWTYYLGSEDLLEQKGHMTYRRGYQFTKEDMLKLKKEDPKSKSIILREDYDIVAVELGYTSVTPCKNTILDDKVYNNLSKE